MIAMECAVCGGRFEAKRATRKYCSPRCRMRASRAPEPLPEARDSAPLIALPKRQPDESGLLAVTIRDLEAAGRLDTPAGQATKLLATILDSGIQDTGSSIAALVRQYQASLQLALDGAQVVETPLERMKRARTLKVG